MTKRILYIAPNSVPLTGAEGICNVKHLRVLLDQGYKIDLISRIFKYKNYPPTELKELGLDLDSLNIVIVDNRFTLKVIFQHIMTFLTFGYVFKGAHWAYEALKVAEDLCRKNHYDAVLTKDFPSEMIGAYLQNKYGLKWIATWNDPYPLEMYPAPYGKGPHTKLHCLKRPLLHRIEKADVHVFPNERLHKYMSQYLNLSDKHICISPHIVEKLEVNMQNCPDDGKLHIIHTGNMLPPRDATSFLQALSSFVHKNEGKEKLRFQMTFQGVMPQNLHDIIEQNSLSEYISVQPPVPYKDSQTAMSQHDVLVIIEAPCNEGIFLPTKVSEAMQLHVPIFTVSPKNGLLHDLYDEGYVSYYADVCDQTMIENEIEKLYRDFLTSSIVPSRTKPEYTAKHIAQLYEQML